MSFYEEDPELIIYCIFRAVHHGTPFPVFICPFFTVSRFRLADRVSLYHSVARPDVPFLVGSTYITITRSIYIPYTP